jgi:acyl-CoA reductase-like NAD-dependent aldehyde dehydrogenase
LVQSIICWPDVAPHLTSHIGISHLTFVGSRNVAHRVAASAAKNLIPACIELGGKDAAIILDDVQNLEQVASVLMRGVFQSGGQNCIGIERVIACPRVYDRLVDLLEPKIKALRVGNALEDDRVTDVGALISDIAFRRLEELVQEAVSQGASLLAGGKQFHHPDYPRGHYFQPTFLANVTPEMRIARIETFAPIFTLMKATGVDDAVRIANSTEYGLGASVFGSKTVQVDKVISGVKTGMVSVNDFGVYYAVQLPFGGTKGSGD